MIQRDKLKPFDMIIRQVKHLTYDEKVTLAKYLALTEGIQMYTPADAKAIIEREVKVRVEQELRAQTSRILIPGMRG